MKKLYRYLIMGSFSVSLLSCQKTFIDLKPPANFTDAVFFNKPEDFKSFSAQFYGYRKADGNWEGGLLPGWNFGTWDNGSDLSANSNGNGADIGYGTIAVGSTNWDYSGIRKCNILLEKAAAYQGAGDISQYVGEAYFFRAFTYFSLLRTFGGVPLVTTALDTDSPELYGPRNSRYEVVALILADLDLAIERLATEQNIAAIDKGRVSKWAAMALKAQVQLYEATWERYVGQTTDGDGITVGAGSNGYDASNVEKYLAGVIANCETIMNDGGYELWDKNADPAMNNLSSWYLFNLEDEESNPGGYTKVSNKEFILYTIYDYTLRQSGINISWTSGQLYPSRKFMDMLLCTDGLPPSKSPLFEGYHSFQSEFQHRDLRLQSYLYGNAALPASITLDFGSLGFSGYGNAKYGVLGFGSRRTDRTESANWPIIRLADVYLMYAEAHIELNGSISDAQLAASINKLRSRAGVAPLTNALVAANGLDMKEEIRRERAVELYREGKRFDDLKRWGILEASLNPSRLGRVVGDASYTTPFKDGSGNPTAAYKPGTYVWGEETVSTPEGNLKAVVISSASNHSVSQKHYLYPIPTSQLLLNDQLLPNPGY